MKKSLSILCVVALLLCSVMIPVSAATAVSITTASTTVDPGAEVKVNINYGTGQLQTGAGNLTYDEGLVLTSVAAGTIWDSASATYTAPGASALKSGIKLSATLGTNPVENANGSLWVATFTAPATAGNYQVTFTPGTFRNKSGKITGLTACDLTITVKGSDPEPVAKTVTYTAVNGTVMASTVALAAPAEAKASGTITTAGTAAEEEVFFYFFPNKGYTTDGMTVNGEAVIGAAGSKKYTVTADAAYDFVFKKIEDAAAIAAKPTGAISGTPAAASLTTFATAAGASEFGILIGAADAWGTDIKADYDAASETGKIRKYAALEANGEGQFAIELNDTAKHFLKNGTYKAYIYAANGSNVTFGDAIDIAIAE